jgi:hypothetical protein
MAQPANVTILYARRMQGPLKRSAGLRFLAAFEWFQRSTVSKLAQRHFSSAVAAGLVGLEGTQSLGMSAFERRRRQQFRLQSRCKQVRGWVAHLDTLFVAGERKTRDNDQRARRRIGTPLSGSMRASHGMKAARMAAAADGGNVRSILRRSSSSSMGGSTCSRASRRSSGCAATPMVR